MIDISLRSGLAIAISVTGATLLAYVLYRQTTPTLPWRLRLVLGILRWLAALIILLLVTDPIIRWMAIEHRRPVIAVLIDDSRSMAYPDSMLKTAEVKSALTPNLLDRLGSKGDLRIFTFSDATREISPEEIQHIEPRGVRTDLVAGFRSVLEGLEVRPSALVVVSDGAVNFGEDAVHFAASLRIPVNAVSLALDEPTPDISVDRIETGGVAYANNDVPVWVQLSGRHGNAIEAELTIRDSTGTLMSRQVVIPGTGARTAFQADIDAGDIGVHRFKVAVSPFEGEAVRTNNSADFSLRVIKGKIRVCLVAPRPSWDFAFARRTLEADPNIDVSVVFTDDRLPALDLDPAVTNLRSEIAELDVLMVFKGANLGQDYDLALEFVRNGGGVLLLSGEPNSRAFTELGPFVVSSAPADEAGLYSASLTDAGRDHDITRVDIGGYGGSWSDLPPLPINGAVTGLRSDATALLTGASGENVLPLLALRSSGAGRVVGFSGSDLWRWDLIPKGFGMESSAFAALLLSSVGWLTETDEVKRLSVSTSKNTYFRGEPVDLFARVADENLKPVPDAAVSARLRSEGSAEVVRSFDMSDRGGGSHYYSVDLLPPGRYAADVVATLNGEPYAQDVVRFSVDERGLEDSGFDGDVGILRELAAAGGGEVYEVDAVGRLADELNPGSVVTRATSDLKLKLSLASFAILVGLLGVEWFIRKRRMLL